MTTKRFMLVVLTVIATVFLASGMVVAATLEDSTVDNTSADNDISGTAGTDLLMGGAGEDLVQAGAGDDTLLADDEAVHTASAPPDDSNDVLQGEDGNDTIIGSAGANTLDGGDGGDSITAGPLHETVTDHVSGGDGDDEISTFNPTPFKDIVDCGNGHDKVEADSFDEVNSNCEEVQVLQPPDDPMVDMEDSTTAAQ